MSKRKAVLLHVLISAIVLGAASVLVLLIWFPYPYSELTGAPRLFLILLGVDLAIGPLLTFVVFKPGKKGLKGDLVVIAMLQFAALAYGISVAANARPVFVVAVRDQFVVVPAHRLSKDDLAKAKPPFDRLPWTGPQLVATKMPETSSERATLLHSALNGRDIDVFPQYYVAYEDGAPQLVARARPIQELIDRRPEQAALLLAGLAERGLDPKTSRYLPIDSAMASMVVVFREGDIHPAGVVAVDGW